MDNNDRKNGPAEAQQTHRDELIERGEARVTTHAHEAAVRLGQPPLPAGVVLVLRDTEHNYPTVLNQRHVTILSEDGLLEISAAKLERV